MLAKLFFLLFLLLPSLAFAQRAATSGEKQVGQTGCKNASSAADFDTIAQCSSKDANAGVFQKAPLFVGQLTVPPYDTTSCDANKAGMIQWTGDNFQGCNGSSWGIFSSNASGIIQAQQTVGSGSFITSSTSYTPIPACKISLTTTGGKVLLLATVDVQNHSGTTWGFLSIFRDGTKLSPYDMASQVGSVEYNTTVPLLWLDQPPAGAHLYQIYIRKGGDGTLGVSTDAPCNLQAIELRTAS